MAPPRKPPREYIFVRQSQIKLAEKNRAAVLAALPGSVAEVAKKVGLSIQTAWRWLRIMKAESPRKLHIARYVPTPGGGNPIAVFDVGDKPDAPKPKKPPKQKVVRKRNAMFQDKECTKCKLPLHYTMFALTKYGTRESWCKDCRNEASLRCYHKRKAKQIAD